MTEVKSCTKCEKVKPLDEFHVRNKAKGWWHSHCKECSLSYNREYNEVNPGTTAKSRQHMMDVDPDGQLERERKRTARKRKYPKVPKAVREALFEAYTECACCGTSDNLTVDHIKSQSKGGTNDWDNLQVLCGLCNSRKYTRTIDYRKSPVAQPKGLT